MKHAPVRRETYREKVYRHTMYMPLLSIGTAITSRRFSTAGKGPNAFERVDRLNETLKGRW